jgi:small subunit ribosomal protein S8
MSQLTDPIADFLTRLRNSVTARQDETVAPYSKIKGEIARILKQEGYISDYSIETEGSHPQIRVRNKYVGVTEIPRVLGGMGITILSTPVGVVSGREAKRKNVGGELLAYVW